MKALWYINYAHTHTHTQTPVFSLVGTWHCSYQTKKFRSSFRLHLEERLEADCVPTYNIQLVSFEDSLRFLLEAVHEDLRKDELIRDWDSKAKGLEQLLVICVGFGAQITGDSHLVTLTVSPEHVCIMRSLELSCKP